MKFGNYLSSAIFLGITLATTTVAGGSPAAAPALPATSTSQGNAQEIICQINRDRERRYLSPIFLHRTLSDAALYLGQRYADNRLDSSYFNQVFNELIAPLGNSVSSSYKILGTFSNDNSYVDELEQSIYDSLFARTLDAIGLYERNGVYTIVLASGLSDRPSRIETCPASSSQFDPNSDKGGSGIKDGVDLPSFLCDINQERIRANVDAFAVHTALQDEAWQQALQMDRLGHYTVDGLRKVDESIYDQRVYVKQLYWVAGDSYHNSKSLVNVLMSSYRDKVLDPKFQVIGVAQKNGFWSVILGSLYRSVRVRNSCPLTLDDVDYTS
ncbi:hypothetical protein IWW36_002867 [Coemansia brasiliensis]|uniref:Uncharacterized protein n=1 Tax=Coemansia brasiliensis TaxID=2650707 RepID=A0A9W8IB77_9FUNG|nr:hypothetical protein IWW36_002867 [Coemansia brasiliensis]